MDAVQPWLRFKQKSLLYRKLLENRRNNYGTLPTAQSPAIVPPLQYCMARRPVASPSLNWRYAAGMPTIPSSSMMPPISLPASSNACGFLRRTSLSHGYVEGAEAPGLQWHGAVHGWAISHHEPASRLPARKPPQTCRNLDMFRKHAAGLADFRASTVSGISFSTVETPEETSSPAQFCLRPRTASTRAGSVPQPIGPVAQLAWKQ